MTVRGIWRWAEADPERPSLVEASGRETTAAWTAEPDQADAAFGGSVSTAGDVDGDGFSDVLVGAETYDNGETDEGGAQVYHGSASGLSVTPDWTGEGNQANARFGLAVDTAGDVNRDGLGDVVVGAHVPVREQHLERVPAGG